MLLELADERPGDKALARREVLSRSERLWPRILATTDTPSAVADVAPLFTPYLKPHLIDVLLAFSQSSHRNRKRNMPVTEYERFSYFHLWVGAAECFTYRGVEDRRVSQ
ncbi:MAG: hypothetical protein ACRDZ1_11635 [Acidimicrobiia bacterium]